MNKRDYLSKLSSACLNANVHRCNVTIVGGGASLLNELKMQTNDIDVHVDEDTFWNLYYEPASTKPIVLEAKGQFPEAQLLGNGGVDFIFATDLPTYPTFKHKQFNVLSKLGLLMYRIDLGRDKDMDDIRALEEHWCKLDETYTKRLKNLIGECNVQ